MAHMFTALFRLKCENHFKKSIQFADNTRHTSLFSLITQQEFLLLQTDTCTFFFCAGSVQSQFSTAKLSSPFGIPDSIHINKLCAYL